MSTRVVKTVKSRSPVKSSKSPGPAAANKAAEKSALAHAKQEEKKAQLLHEYQYNTTDVESLRNQIRSIKHQIESEQSEINHFQHQKSKFQQFESIQKESRENLKLELRNKLKIKADLEEKHSFELNLYKQKVKHLLQQQQSQQFLLKYEGELELHNVQLENRNKNNDFNMNNRLIAANQREQELEYYNKMNAMKLQQEQSIMKLRLEFEAKADEIGANYNKKYRVSREQAEEIRREEIARLELKKNTHIQELINKHKKKFEKIKKYFSDITHANLELIKNLKEEVGDMKKKENSIHKEVNEIKVINKKLTKPLNENKALISSLKQQLTEYEENKSQLWETQTNLMELNEALKQREWEHEILLQKFNLINEEKQQLEQALNQTIYEKQQQIGFTNLITIKKIQAINRDIEKTEAALAEILASTNLHPSVIGDIKHSLEEVILNKNRVIQRLEDSIEKLKIQFQEMQNNYEEQLITAQIPLEELGFQTSQPYNEVVS